VSILREVIAVIVNLDTWEIIVNQISTSAQTTLVRMELPVSILMAVIAVTVNLDILATTVNQI